MKCPGKKQRIFFECEGESEESHGKFLEFLFGKKTFGT